MRIFSIVLPLALAIGELGGKMMSGPHKVRVKIGDAEFEAEGSEETVKEQYDRFLASLPAAQTAKKLGDTASADEGRQAAGGDPDTALARAFKDEADVVSLRLHPKGDNRDADALLMILYGYLMLKGQREVLSTQLARSAAQTGLGLDRIDRTMAKNEPYCGRGGERKGTYYSLNNVGINRAKELLAMTFQ
jgi:hypothetical protein